MKSKWFLLFTLPAAVYLFIAFASCNKEKKCVKCMDEAPFVIKDLKLQMGNLDITIQQTPIWVKKTYGDLNYGDQRLTDDQFMKINSAIDKSHSPEVIIFYFTKTLVDNGTFGNEDIKGISTFTIENKMVMHHFYENKKGVFERDPYLSVHTNALSINAVLDINRQRIKTPQSSILLLDRTPAEGFVIRNKTDILRKVVNHYSEIKEAANRQFQRDTLPLEDVILLLSAQYDEVMASCGGWCWESMPGTCVRNIDRPYPASWRCEQRSGGTRGCKATTLESEISESQSASDEEIAMAFDYRLLYSVRDELLSRNSLGAKYRSYYYYFSDVYIADIDLSLALETMEALIDLNTQLVKLQDTSGVYDHEIFLDEQLRSKILHIMERYRNVYHDYYTELLMNDFKNDIDILMFNKTVTEVRELFAS